MKTGDLDILILPGLGGGDGDYWYNRWARQMTTASRVEQANFWEIDLTAWIAMCVQEINKATKPVVLVGHSAGAMTVAHGAKIFREHGVKGAFLVAPPDVEACVDEIPETQAFLPVPRDPLPFPSYLIASSTDPYCNIETAADYAGAWGSRFYDAGDAGHINEESGHGPWPEGLLMFGRFVKLLGS